jgi:virginiamycin B lyase
VRLTEYPVPSGSHPHDVAPASDGMVWYTAQATGRLGRLDPATGRTEELPLGEGAAPHGVIVGPDGAPWITDGGLNAIVRVDPATKVVRRFPLPVDRPAVNLNTATFDQRGRLWFTGQRGVYGSVDPRAGRLGRYDPAAGRWKEWPLPGQAPQPYAVYVDDRDMVWLSDFAANALVRFDPASEGFASFPLPTADSRVRQLLGRPGEVWGAASAADKLVVARTAP